MHDVDISHPTHCFMHFAFFGRWTPPLATASSLCEAPPGLLATTFLRGGFADSRHCVDPWKRAKSTKASLLQSEGDETFQEVVQKLGRSSRESWWACLVWDTPVVGLFLICGHARKRFNPQPVVWTFLPKKTSFEVVKMHWFLRSLFFLP